MTALDLAVVTAAGLAVITGSVPVPNPAATQHLTTIDRARTEITRLETELDQRDWFMNDRGESLLRALDWARRELHNAEDRLLSLYQHGRRTNTTLAANAALAA